MLALREFLSLMLVAQSPTKQAVLEEKEKRRCDCSSSEPCFVRTCQLLCAKMRASTDQSQLAASGECALGLYQKLATQAS